MAQQYMPPVPIPAIHDTAVQLVDQKIREGCQWALQSRDRQRIRDSCRDRVHVAAKELVEANNSLKEMDKSYQLQLYQLFVTHSVIYGYAFEEIEASGDFNGESDKKMKLYYWTGVWVHNYCYFHLQNRQIGSSASAAQDYVRIYESSEAAILFLQAYYGRTGCFNINGQIASLKLIKQRVCAAMFARFVQNKTEELILCIYIFQLYFSTFVPLTNCVCINILQIDLLNVGLNAT